MRQRQLHIRRRRVPYTAWDRYIRIQFARRAYQRTLGGATTITYSYDGLGRRVGRTDSSGTYQYLYGIPGRLYLVTSVRDPGNVLTTLYYDGNGLLFAMDRGGSMYYVGTDQIGTPHVVADSTGTVVKVVEYDSFGKRLSDSNSGFDLPIGFAGGLEDTDTGLVRFGYRDFEQTSGRWTARDPALYEGGQANLYVYVGNDPVSLRDPLGLWCIGGSVYDVVGFGAELCCENGVCSRCAEVGIGGGTSVSVGLGGPKETGSNILSEAGASCGPAGGSSSARTTSSAERLAMQRGVRGHLRLTRQVTQELAKVLVRPSAATRLSSPHKNASGSEVSCIG